MSDLTMLRKEIAFGFVAAGFLTVLVPAPAWNDLFFHGHGVLTTLENVVVGPAVAIISFVCSIGNVALAAALWHGGISFGGVVSFVFADLITLPLLLIYRKQYGTRLAARMLAVFWLVMSIAGLITEELFRAAGWIPTHRPAVATSDVVRLDATTILNVLALTVFAVLYRLYRHRDRFGERAMTYATDPVCGMQVEVAHAPASRPHDGSRLYFCSEHCRDRFARDADHKVG
jgi:YHS domain-containing protein